MNPTDTRGGAPLPPPRYPFGDQLPPPGRTLLVGPGVHWLRMPLPFALDHINLWLLEDGDGWAIVDTGIGNEATRALWEALFAGTMGGRPVTRIIVTHYHPDHAGNAGWLAERTGAPVFMTTGEFLTAHAVRDNAAGLDHESTLAHYRANGLDLGDGTASGVLGNGYRRGVPELPTRYRRLMDGDRLRIGGHDWRVICVYGHAPEQATLFCESLGLFISGDQVLPRITTNVGVWGNQPDANPLRRYLDSLDVLARLPAGVRVLPSHDRVFEGLHDRIANLHQHHEDRLAKLLAACDEPRTAHDILGVLFRRQLDDHQMRFAMAEAVAHLHLLHAEGRVERIEKQGVRRYRRVAYPPPTTDGGTIMSGAHGHHHGDHEGGSKKIGLLIAVLALVLAVSETLGKGAQTSALNYNIEAANLWSFFQGKTIRMTAVRTAAEQAQASLATLPMQAPGREAIQAQVEAWKKTAARYDTEPETGEGRKELMARAKETEKKRDQALAAYHKFELGSAAVQVAIVLASASIITGLAALVWIAGGLGLLGVAFCVLGAFWPTMHFF